MKDQLRKKEETLRQIRGELTVATRDLEKLPPRVETVEEEVWIALTHVLMQKTLREKPRDHPDERAARVKEVQLQLEVREDDQITLYD